MVFALVVVYNKICSDLKILNKLIVYGDLSIIVFDNSTSENNNEQWCKVNNIKYYGLKKNLGLSKAYNYVIEKSSFKPKDYLLILDDDTNIDEKFIDYLKKEIERNYSDVYVPVVRAGNIIMSPCNIKYKYFASKIDNLNDLANHNITAINSGMCIKCSVFSKCRYNENLFLDYVDHDFMEQIRKNNYSVTCLDINILQNYSRMEKPSLEVAVMRFKIQAKDIYEYCSKRKATWFFYLSMGKFAVEQCIKYKTFAFLKYFIINKSRDVNGKKY